MKAVICGAGIAGLALAHRMATLGADTIVLERAPGPRNQGYLIDFFGTGYDAAEAMGVLQAIEQLACHVEEASLLDGTGRQRSGLSHTQFAKTVDGRLLNIMRPDLERAPREQLPPQVELRLGWLVPEALHRCPPPAEIYYDQVAQIEMRHWSHGRVVLVGDACYAVSLLAGQGASLAVAGAFVLAGQLTRPDPIETRLQRYEQLMRPIVVEKQKLARHSARWFLPETALQLRVRRIAMRLGRLPGIDRYVAGVVAGKSTALITNLRRESDSPVLTGAEPGAHR